MKIKPYKDQETGKKEQVEAMFDSIAGNYDFLNHFLSFGIDKIWRKKLIKLVKRRNVKNMLDVATGTADVAIKAAKIPGITIKGIDISEKMIEIGNQKVKKAGLESTITLSKGDAETILFNNDTFDAVTVAFGVRNFENLNHGLVEMHRVLKNGGAAIILEFSKPQHFPFKQLYMFYFRYILPIIGRIVSKDQSAYTYLPDSVYNFPFGNDFINELKKAGFSKCSYKTLTFGVATIYIGEKS